MWQNNCLLVECLVLHSMHPEITKIKKTSANARLGRRTHNEAYVTTAAYLSLKNLIKIYGIMAENYGRKRYLLCFCAFLTRLFVSRKTVTFRKTCPKSDFYKYLSCVQSAVSIKISQFAQRISEQVCQSTGCR